jgi:hypothetical protein
LDLESRELNGKLVLVPARVLLVVIDAATPRVVCPAVRTGRLPTMQRLAEAGTMHEASVTIFPSITPAATTSIITGCYPAEHGIAGASWFDEATEEIAYYGDDFWIIAREGFGEFIRDFLLRLNGDRLIAPTLFEMVERTGRTAACLNYLVFRGLSAHKVAIPSALAALPGVPFTETVEGPSVLSLGDFVGPRTPRGRRLKGEGGIFHRFGMDDASTGAMLRDLMAEGSLADFTVAYFADNDYRSHEVGPHAALNVVDGVDRMLGEAFEAAGGLERVLRDTFVAITSDHGHCEVLADPSRAEIRLNDLLANFPQAALGRAWRRRDALMICPNMRAAQIYLHYPGPDTALQVISDALTDPRVELAIWRSALTVPGASGYSVASRTGRLTFARGGEGEAVTARDAFGASWIWQGDSAVLDFHVDAGRLEFGQFPNAFDRIAGVLDLNKSGDIWVTAKPGCEFSVEGGDAHPGGASHGALHALDSLSPVIVAGPSPVTLPRHLRSVDLAPLCMQLLGAEMRYKVGDAR